LRYYREDLLRVAAVVTQPFYLWLYPSSTLPIPTDKAVKKDEEGVTALC
jgi:hypothetical protein